MAMKCVHKGCGKTLPEAEFKSENCVYHPGPPIFHEGQKGWQCCKPRVLTFDEFMTIPPCTTGNHSTVDDTPKPAAKPRDEDIDAKVRAINEQNATLQPAVARVAQAAQAPRPSPSPAPPEDESDDPDAKVPDGVTCKRKACGSVYKTGQDRSQEQCTHHPGYPIFHEGSKGYSCCKPRMLDFDDFMKIPGCKTKPRHLFVGKKKDASVEEELKEVRHDFYQTATTVIASLYLKKINKDSSTIKFVDANTVDLDLRTADNKRYNELISLFGPIKPEESKFKIMGTKLELTLAKADGAGWQVLKADEAHTGRIIQAGRAGTV